MGKFRVATKANPWYKDGKTFDDPMAGLKTESIKEQLRASLKSLRYTWLPRARWIVNAPRTTREFDILRWLFETVGTRQRYWTVTRLT